MTTHRGVDPDPTAAAELVTTAAAVVVECLRADGARLTVLNNLVRRVAPENVGVLVSVVATFAARMAQPDAQALIHNLDTTSELVRGRDQ